MKINVVLIVLFNRWESNSYTILTPSLNTSEWKPPIKELSENEQPIDVVKKLFSEQVNVSPNWCDFKLLELVNIDGECYCVYYTYWPITHVKSTTLIDVSTVSYDHKLYEQLTKAIRT